ncbi:hypothetical protein SS50377_26383 [Spironucleus salmonicida]|uniref:Uncharacterized protein n=1 Tax=Spironucleus salmonicida TaxID=348837 RepID=V6LT48_9EUKA|nr:hypothetical protein SS50377_26383 [Spironucleus salmonicida]|eukprot:EST47750.1 Hypothetical protein SS50377_12149 [Spironucleus salmonicida]
MSQVYVQDLSEKLENNTPLTSREQAYLEQSYANAQYQNYTVRDREVRAKRIENELNNKLKNTNQAEYQDQQHIQLLKLQIQKEVKIYNQLKEVYENAKTEKLILMEEFDNLTKPRPPQATQNDVSYFQQQIASFESQNYDLKQKIRDTHKKIDEMAVFLQQNSEKQLIQVLDRKIKEEKRLNDKIRLEVYEKNNELYLMREKVKQEKRMCKAVSSKVE